MSQIFFRVLRVLLRIVNKGYKQLGSISANKNTLIANNNLKIAIFIFKCLVTLGSMLVSCCKNEGN
jgi:hypothetical protein